MLKMSLEAKNIGFRYGNGKWILREFNLILNPGEIIGLVGPSGCGKTTFAKILAGYEKVKEGQIILDEMALPVYGYNPVQLVFQHPEKAVNPKWTIQKILNEGWEVEIDILKAFGIEKDWLKKWPNELSGGELQRVCVARALGPKTRYLIADEMTSMLDAITQVHIWDVVLGEVKKRNLGVLIISHDQQLINRLCSRVCKF